VPWDEQSPEKLPESLAGGFEVESWSADGDQLAGQVPSHIAVFSLVSRGYRLFPVDGVSPVWLSDNRRMLFWRGGNVHLLDTKTSRFHEVLDLKLDSIDYRFDISSDDRTIYFSRIHSEADIWMVTLDEAPR
jgi:hypothetical protein